jgi:hypothetical protein
VKDLAGVGLWHGRTPQVLVERTTHQMHLTLQRLLQRVQVGASCFPSRLFEAKRCQRHLHHEVPLCRPTRIR